MKWIASKYFCRLSHNKSGICYGLVYSFLFFPNFFLFREQWIETRCRQYDHTTTLSGNPFYCSNYQTFLRSFRSFAFHVTIFH